MNYYDHNLEAEAPKLWWYMPPTFLEDATIPSTIFYAFYAF